MAHLSNGTSPHPVRVGIAGLGRSGWNIHARALEAVPELFEIAAVTDPEESRRGEAVSRFGCRAYPTLGALLNDDAVDLVVVASPTHLHAAHAVSALAAGKHVVCEKPMAMRVQDADDMIAAARRHGRVLTVFQNRRFEPHVAQLREILAGGELGRIVYVRAAVHKFTRRWDWQALRQYGGGMLSNIGSHILDLMLELFPITEPSVCSHLESVLTLGDADDHCLLMIRPAQGPVLYLEITNAGAFEQDLWTVLGTRGSLRGSPQKLEWRVSDFDHLPRRQLEHGAVSDRRYPHDDVEWREHAWTAPPEQLASSFTHAAFYRDLHRALTTGAAPAVTPQSVRRLVALLEQGRQPPAVHVPPAVSLPVPPLASLHPPAALVPNG